MATRTDLTRNQTLVLDRLEKSEGPLSAYALLDQLRDDGFRAPLQVYRALDTLMKSGLVHRLESINSFVACHGHHHHDHGITGFAICETCGQVTEFTDPVLSERLEAWAQATGFKASKAAIELRGTCGKCASA
ncbi:Fur family transcriptional regulator [Mesorhizobium australicum]|uniref:Fur family transcriptional regulator, zinc uptake regulator n=1 Tax=Mesorhizobium australicum TaxID=536018 RepID=A0A1X7N4L6_9HYPH|nr:Fur family transcriptional regulator [Mesorhizobium australicum]SMH32331.1 Fur family transcriptional regulator, zinc uptake regulator [Mesorhizobium australicum]